MRDRSFCMIPRFGHMAYGILHGCVIGITIAQRVIPLQGMRIPCSAREMHNVALSIVHEYRSDCWLSLGPVCLSVGPGASGLMPPDCLLVCVIGGRSECAPAWCCGVCYGKNHAQCMHTARGTPMHCCLLLYCIVIVPYQ